MYAIKIVTEFSRVLGCYKNNLHNNYEEFRFKLKPDIGFSNIK